MKLHYMHTVNPRKACATAKYLRLPVEYVPIDVARGGLRTDEYLALNPNGLAPVLEVDGRTIWESAAIMMYFAVRAGSTLWPLDEPMKQVEVMRWITWDARTFLPAAGIFYMERFVKPRLLGAPTDEAELDRKAPLFHRAARVLESHLGGREFLVGDALTIADFCVGALLPSAEEIGLALDEYANIQRWHEGLMKIDAWRDPWPR